MNDKDRIEEVIEYYFQPKNFISKKEQYDSLVDELNTYLFYDDLKLEKNGKVAKLVRINNNIYASKDSLSKSAISIILQNDVFNHVKSLLESGHYFNAVEESYKVVRDKLSSIAGTEKATDSFNENNYIKIFGHQAQSRAEKDFFEGVKFLHMAIQFLRNEKSHTSARKLDKNLALHYIVLASLAYGLINRKS